MPREGLRGHQQQQSGGGEDVQHDAAHTSQNPDVSSITMSSQNFALLMETIQEHQTNLTTHLLAQLRRDQRESTPLGSSGSASGVAASLAGANFALCQAKFCGEPRESVENFIDAVEIYKTATGISDESAVKGLALLLSGIAGTWWQGVKQDIKNWKDALDSLKSAFGERKPHFQIYNDLRTIKQNGQMADLFIAQVRALLAKLPKGDISEKVALDMVYGMLDSRIRRRVERDDVKTFEELLRKARSVEDSLKDDQPVGNVQQRARAPPGGPPLRSWHTVATSAPPARGAQAPLTWESSQPRSGVQRGGSLSQQQDPGASGIQATPQSGDKDGQTVKSELKTTDCRPKLS
ncbi:hypothetical protein NE865_11024 [Phthorimaea operculella]|nr:hypothetical protein NE865_11024 [Phthorimaea operculella]